jgi:hypothetical protein
MRRVPRDGAHLCMSSYWGSIIAVGSLAIWIGYARELARQVQNSMVVGFGCYPQIAASHQRKCQEDSVVDGVCNTRWIVAMVTGERKS